MQACLPDSIWSERNLSWHQQETWFGPLTVWLKPRLRRDSVRRLRPGRHRDLCWDDEAWLDLVQDVVACDLDGLLQDLGEELRGAVLRTYHGTRTEDAGVFFREGLRVHDRTALTRRLKAIMAGLPGGSDASIERGIAKIENDHDIGRLHVVADERPLLRHAAHYLIYGSEWMLAVSDGPARRRLMAHGTPTLLEIDLPLSRPAASDRKEFARVMVREWVRLTCNRTDWSAPIDFTFRLDADIPPACIVGHRHPTDLRDPTEGYRSCIIEVGTCLHCAPTTTVDGTARTADADNGAGG